MSFQEFKEVMKVLLSVGFIGTLLITYLLYKFAEVTYKKAHKTSQTVQKLNSSKQLYTVIFEIDSKNKTLQEVQAERLQMRKILGGI